MKYKYFDLLLGLFVAVLLISNIVSVKIIQFGPFTFDGGTILFPIVYIFGDVLTEVYGYVRARRVIWTGFFAAALMSASIIAIGKMPAAAGWANQAAYEAVLGATPRIFLASLVAYWLGEFSNSYTLAKIKIVTNGRWFWMRTIGSTVIGEGIDTIIFVAIAFSGIIPWGLLLTVVVSNYIFKVCFEIIATPVTYLVVSRLKKSEEMDHFDNTTNFNPFNVSLKE